MTVLASTIISNARRLLIDTNNAVQRWSDATLLAMLNEGQKALVVLNPKATATTMPMLLLEGTHQTIPSDGMAFFRLTRNLGSSGAAGRAITPVAFEAINLGAPTWHSVSTSPDVWQFAPDPIDQRRFFVSPPAVNGVAVEVSYAVLPADIATVGSAITVPDWYQAALVDYIVYRTLSENDGDAPARERAQMHYTYFTNQVMGVPAYTPPRRTTGGA